MLSTYESSFGDRLRRNVGRVMSDIVTSLQMERAFPILFQSWSPSCVVCTSDLWPFEYQLSYQASRRKVPSIVLQHGNLIYFYWPFIASRFVLWGQQSFDDMQSFGAPGDRLAIGGMPSSDKVFNRTPETTYNGEAKKPVCLILSHTHARHMEPELYLSYKRFLSQLIPAAPFVQWKVKLHPSEDRSFYEDLGHQVTAAIEFYPASKTLHEALREADVATTLYSTSGMEAMTMGLPMIVPIVSPRMTEPNLLPQLPGALRVYTPEEFELQLEAMVSNPGKRAGQVEAQNAILKHCFSNQGRASGAIVDILENCVNSPELASGSTRYMPAFEASTV